MLLEILSESEIPNWEIPKWAEFTVLGMLILALIRLFLNEAISRRSIKKKEEKMANTQQKDKKNPKSKGIRDYLSETTFTFDPEDDNLLVSKANPALRVRLIPGNSRDTVLFGFNFDHQFGTGLGYFKMSILECSQFYSDEGSDNITFVKRSASKWEDFGQKLVELIFIHYETKYPVHVE